MYSCPKSQIPNPSNLKSQIYNTKNPKSLNTHLERKTSNLKYNISHPNFLSPEYWRMSCNMNLKFSIYNRSASTNTGLARQDIPLHISNLAPHTSNLKSHLPNITFHSNIRTHHPESSNINPEQQILHHRTLHMDGRARRVLWWRMPCLIFLGLLITHLLVSTCLWLRGCRERLSDAQTRWPPMGSISTPRLSNGICGHTHTHAHTMHAWTHGHTRGHTGSTWTHAWTHTPHTHRQTLLARVSILIQY